MGELVLDGHIAGGVDIGIGRLQRVVDGDATPVIFDARRFQIQGLDVGRTAHGQQYLVDDDDLLFAVQLKVDGLAVFDAFPSP